MFYNFICLFVSLQIMWARQLKGANASYQILTIGDSTHINDNRFLITKSTVNNVIFRLMLLFTVLQTQFKIWKNPLAIHIFRSSAGMNPKIPPELFEPWITF